MQKEEKVDNDQNETIKNQNSKNNTKLVKAFRQKVETRIKISCEQLLEILQTLIPENRDAETKVFLIKMIGDYHRYMAEFTND